MLKIEIIWPPKTLEKIINGKNKFISLNSASNSDKLARNMRFFFVKYKWSGYGEQFPVVVR